MIDVVVIYDGPDACEKCEGWKRIDDGDDGVSWKFWAELPEQSAMAVRMGLVKPVECPRCKGEGTEPAFTDEEQISH